VRTLTEEVPIGKYTCEKCPHRKIKIHWCKKFKVVLVRYMGHLIRPKECLEAEYPRRSDLAAYGYDGCLEHMRDELDISVNGK